MLGREPDQVSGGSRLDERARRAGTAMRIEQLPELRDLRLNLSQRARRRSIVVDIVGEAIDRNDAVRVQQENHKNRSLLRAAEPKRTVLTEYLERAKDPEGEQALTVAAS